MKQILDEKRTSFYEEKKSRNENWKKQGTKKVFVNINVCTYFAACLISTTIFPLYLGVTSFTNSSAIAYNVMYITIFFLFLISVKHIFEKISNFWIRLTLFWK